MARLSMGGFFKNFVKGAAQQYNTNVAYLEQQKVEEEKQKKKEERQFGYDKRLKTMELDYKSKLEGLKAEKEKKIFGEYEFKDPNKQKIVLQVPKTTIFATEKDKYSKALDLIENLDFDKLKTELTPNSYRSLINDTIRNYEGLSTVKPGKEDGDVVVVYDPRFYDKIQKHPDLLDALALKINRDSEWTRNMIKTSKPNSILSDKPTLSIAPDSITMNINGFYGLDAKEKFFKPEDVSIVSKIIGTESKDSVIDFMNKKQKLMERETLKAQKDFGTKAAIFTGSDYINALSVAKKAMSTLEPTQLNELSPVVGKTIRDAILQLPNGKAIVNDPQVFHDVVRTLLPKGANPPLMQTNSQAAMLGKQAMFMKKFGSKGANIALNSVSKADQAGRRYQRAKAISILVDSGAGTGAAAQTESYFVGLAEQSKALITRLTGYEFGQTSQQIKDILSNAQTKADQETRPLEREKILRDAVLRYNTTLMVFDIATMAQDAGGGFTAGGSAVRLSDGDVKLSSKALADRLLEIPGQVQAVASQVAEFAEREMVIFDMLANGDLEDTKAALVMLNAYRGELGSYVSALQDGRFSEILPSIPDGAKEPEGYTFKKTETQDIAEEENQIVGTGTLTNNQPKKIKKAF
jgi:hypothetical protein